jgi:hypothetical protein
MGPDARGEPTEAVHAANQFFEMIAPPSVPQEPMDREGVALDPRVSHRPRKSDGGDLGLGEHPGHVRGRPSLEPVPRYYDEARVRGYTRSPARVVAPGAPDHPTPEHMRRPRSRYDRYEAARPERHMARSRSPARGDAPHPGEPLLREAHPSGRGPPYDHVYRERSPVVMRTARTPGDERRDYAPTGGAPERYVTYPDGRTRVEYGGSHGERMDYVAGRRVASPAQRGVGSYLVGDYPGHEKGVRYARHPDEVHDEMYIEEGGRVYRVEDSTRHPDDARGSGASQQLRY